MTDETPKKRPMSEIGHLFLSNVRDLHANGQGRPKRTPPAGQRQEPAGAEPPSAGGMSPGATGLPANHGLPPGGKAYRPDFSIDLTPEEFAEVFGEPQPAMAEDESSDEDGDTARAAPPVSALIASHLNGKQLDRCREFARHVASRGERVGLIELDGSEFRVSCFERAAQPAVSGIGTSPETPLVPADCCDPRQMAEAIEELNHDVDRWLLVLPNPRLPEAKALLRLVDRWVLLSTCDHDGVVSSYRTLKGLSDLHRPRLTLALLDVGLSDADGQDVQRVHRKLSGVCEQFLDWPLDLEPEPAVRKTHRVTEHLVLVHQTNRDKAQLANPVQWPVVADFLARAKTTAERQQQRAALTHQAAPDEITADLERDAREIPAASPVRELVGDVVIPTAPVVAPAPSVKEPSMPEMKLPEAAPPAAPAPTAATTADAAEQVLDLTDPQGTPDSILSAVLHGGGPSTAADFVECPVRAPMCNEARLAVGRDRSLVLFAVARQGLTDLRSIGQAYRWLRENLSLIGMAVPQFAIDTHQTPRLRLLVDHGDLSADVLQPMLQTDHVTVQSYRKLRWGGKTGLLLEAA